MRIEALPLLSDNYGWLLEEEGGSSCAVVDPSQAAPVISRVRERGSRLRWILATHHHGDHIGGIDELVAEFPGVEVICSSADRRVVPHASRTLDDGERITVAGAEVTGMLVPGHTRGAMAYWVPAARAVFTGDTLFLSGCGRLFEGTFEQMYASLSRLAQLPADTWVYCGHEYTEKNLRFALSVDPDNVALQERLQEVETLRAKGQPTVPARLDVELRTNPFLRCDQPAFAQLGGEALAVFAELRRRRDRF